MSIQWFPGHMHKARLEMEAVLPKVHVVVEILDARIPYSSENPLLAEIRGDKPCLKVLAKSDLADPKWTASWLEHFQSIDHIAAQSVTSKEIPTIRRLKQAIGELARHREGKTATAMVVGIPNVGKSTIINVLAGRKVAKTGNTPAITKQQQTVRIGDGVTLLDTPGMLWPKVENPNSGLRLGVVGSVKETATDDADLGFFAAGYLRQHYPERLAQRYELEAVPGTDLETVESIGRRRGCIGRGNLVDIDRAARILVMDIRSGALGRVTFETPAIMSDEKRLTAIAMSEKTQRDNSKDQKRKQRFRDQQRAKRNARDRH